MTDDEHRKEAARQCADALFGMYLGERLKIDDDEEVLAVPRGWIFYKGTTGTFVPHPPPAPTIKSKLDLSPGIIV
tara:strand:- start:10742 stop:10966 length:225 start_codon:yes stop_codon:yes gene_type:complete